MKIEPMRAEFARPSVIKLTLRELLDAQPALARLATEKMPVKVAYQVARMLKAVQPDVDEFLAQRNKLIKQYGMAREPLSAQERETHGAEVIEVMAENLDAYRRDIEALTGMDITVDREPLVLTDVERITPADLLALGSLIAE